MRAFGLKGAIAIVPNGVALPERLGPHSKGAAGGATRRLVFLGRLDEKKGVRELIEAWAALSPKDMGNWILDVAGWGKESYVKGLDALAATLGSTDSLRLHGPKFGAEKDELLRSANAFILPSYSEGLPMAVLEAWSYGLPVLMTDFCNLPEGFDVGAARRIDTGTAGTLRGLQQLFALSDEELATMGTIGRTYVKRAYYWSSIADSMCEVYNWCVERGTYPLPRSGMFWPSGCLDRC